MCTVGETLQLNQKSEPIWFKENDDLTSEFDCTTHIV